MHGIKREQTLKSAKEKAAIRTKLARFQMLSRVLLDQKRKKVYNEEALANTELMLKRQPDFNTIWNYRREILLNITEILDGDACKGIWVKDLKLVAYGLGHKNPKSYCLWHHRRWIVTQWIEGVAKASRNEILQQELGLCTTFLKADERNFHCWNYRRFIAEKTKLTPEVNFDFTTEKIQENFSNYSALHQRMLLFKQMGAQPGCAELSNDAKQKIASQVDTELEMVNQAIFTEPDDQSSWIYMRSLLAWAREKLGDSLTMPMVDKMIQSCQELLEDDEDLKWPLVTQFHFLKMKGKVKELNISKLAIIDPWHANYYFDQKTPDTE